MKTANVIKYKKEGYLKVVKNSLEKKNAFKKLNINTLIPGFSYKNHKELPYLALLKQGNFHLRLKTNQMEYVFLHLSASHDDQVT